MQTNNLFPPILDTYTAGFLYTAKKCDVPFKLSPYIDPDLIKSIWVSVVNAKTNQSVLNTSTEVLAAKFRHGENNLSYSILSSNLREGWQPGQTYKIQMRFCSKDVEDVGTGSSAIIDSSDYFSEWSTATLVTPIRDFKFKTSSPQPSEDENIDIMNPYVNTITGTVDYGDTKEYLNEYRIKIRYEKEKLYDSGLCYTDSLNPNNFIHNINIGLEEGKTYTFEYLFISNSLYSRRETRTVRLADKTTSILPLNLKTDLEPEQGRIKLTISNTNDVNFNSNLLIKRSSHESNFLYWEDVKIVTVNLNAEIKNFITYDYSADSGIWYKYSIFQIDSEQNLISRPIEIDEPIMMILNDMFINGNERQLKIKFNPNINSYQHTLLESSTQTIGGKYPFIKRNSNLNYRQLGISGLITIHMDEDDDYFVKREKKDNIWEHIWENNGNNLFITKDELYNGQTSLYDTYNSNNNIGRYNDTVLERKFREKVIEFLLDGKVKLLRSPTEPSMLVRLMNVSFTPNQSLGRMVYNFSATAHEIADCTLENISKYKIQENRGYQEIVQDEIVDENKITRNFSVQGPVDYFEYLNVKIENLLDRLDPGSGNGAFQLSYASNVSMTQLHPEGTSVYYMGYKVFKDGEDYKVYRNEENVEEILEKQIIFYYKVPTSSTIHSTVREAIASQTYDFSDLGDITFLAIAIPEETNLVCKLNANLTGYHVIEGDVYYE